MDTNLLSNIHKLFSERIDIFSSVEFNKVSAGLCYAVVQSSVKSHHSHTPPLSPGLRDDWNHQNQLKDVPGVCPPAHIWPLRAAADPGRLPLPADVPVAVRLRWEPCALPAGRDSGELRPPLPGSCTNGAECDRSHLWARLKLKVQHRQLVCSEHHITNTDRIPITYCHIVTIQLIQIQIIL